jgi:hypothetical protein
MISINVLNVLLLKKNKKKRENTNHSYDRCVNEYTMNSLLPIFLAFSILRKKCLSISKGMVISHMHSLSLF